MSVQFLAAWNGFEEDQVVHTLPGAEETRLIGLGLCRAYVAGQDGRSLSPLMVNPATGEQSAGGAPVSGDGIGGTYDLVVIGATPNGLWAAMEANRNGLRSIVFEANDWVGGMLTGGLAATDIAYTEFSGQIGGDATAFYRDCAAEIGLTYEAAWRNAMTLEPRVVQRVLKRWLDASNVKVVTNAPLLNVEKTGTNITHVTCGPYRVGLLGWHDATYEGDLIRHPAAGISWTIGREANATYGESYNGIRPVGATANFADGVSPFVVDGVEASGLLPSVNTDALGANGSASPWVMAPCKRLTVCKSSPGGGAFTKVPFPQPKNYDPLNYELLGRHAALAYGGLTTITSQMLYVSIYGTVKNDMNNGAMPLGVNWLNPSRYINERILGTQAQRKAFDADYDDYVIGLFKFISTDPRFPAAVRADAASIGLCSNEFEAYGGMTPQLYVREGPRLVGDTVLKDADLLAARSWTDGIAPAYYGMDSHQNQRVYIPGTGVKNEGYMLQPVATVPNEIPFRICLPKVSECTNGTVGFGVSATHAAFSSLRMEPIGIQVGQACGRAHAVAKRNGVRVSQVSGAQVRAEVNRWKFSVPSGAVLSADGATYLQGTVTTVGTWASGNLSVGEPPHYVSAETGAYKRFQPNVPSAGPVRVSIRYPVKNASVRSAVAPFTISHAAGTNNFTQNQNGSQATPGQGGDWVVLGEFNFRAGYPSPDFLDAKTDGLGGSTVIQSAKFEFIGR